jgi:hypothetical protein
MKTFALAARHPLALAVLSGAIAAGLLVAIWLLPLGLLVYGAMVALTARDPRMEARAARPERPRVIAPAFKQPLDQIEQSGREIERLVGETKGPLARLIGPIAEQARELLTQSYGLAQKGSVIDQFLASTQPGKVRQQIAEVDGQLPRVSDDYTRQQLEETRQALLEQENNIAALHTYRERIVAQLNNVAANLSRVYTDTLRLRAAEATDVTSESGEVAERLSNLTADVDAFQQVLEGAIGQAGAS